jgi:hypothetical protein
MSATQLTPSDIAAWYRSQIAKYKRLLAAHEAEFPPSDWLATSAPTPEATPGKIDAAAIKSYVSQRGARAADLAEYFGVRVQAIRSIIDDPASGLSDKDRGWVKITDGHHVFVNGS